MKKTLLIIMALAGLFLSASEAEAKGRFSITSRVVFDLSNIGVRGNLDVYSTRLGFTGGVDDEDLIAPQ